MGIETQIAASWLRAMTRVGDEAKVIRRNSDGDDIECSVLVRELKVSVASSDMDLGSTSQGTLRRFLVLFKDFPGWIVPLNKAKDILLWNDLELSILNLDDATRRVVGETIAYEIDTFGQ